MFYIFPVIDCPNESFLDALLENSELAKYQSSTLSEHDAAHAVIHFTPKEILENHKYIEWMERFRITTKHILISDICSGMGSEAVHRIQHKLNLIDENMFPLLKGDDVSTVSNAGETKVGFMNDVKLQILTTKTLFKYSLRPDIQSDYSNIITLNPADYVNETMTTEDFPEQLAQLKSRLETMNTSATEYPKIVFLGTGSCIPNKTRNTSGILLQVT